MESINHKKRPSTSFNVMSSQQKQHNLSNQREKSQTSLIQGQGLIGVPKRAQFGYGSAISAGDNQFILRSEPHSSVQLKHPTGKVISTKQSRRDLHHPQPESDDHISSSKQSAQHLTIHGSILNVAQNSLPEIRRSNQDYGDRNTKDSMPESIATKYHN